jgi:hypothetical protein
LRWIGWDWEVELRRWVGVVVVGLVAAAGLADPVYAGIGPGGPYPGGLEVRLAGVERMPSADAATCDRGGCRAGSAPGTRLVRVDIALSLPPGAAPVPLAILAGTRTGIDLTAGGPVAVDCGNLTETAVLCTDLTAAPPDRVAPGETVVICESFDVPSGMLADLTVTVAPPVRDGPMPVATFHARA